MHFNRSLVILFIAFIGIVNNKTVFAQQLNIDKQKKAIEGYDPVAYQTLNKAVKGKSTIIAKFDGAIYWFESPRHKTLFEANPTKYAPAYGGWCAFAMGDNGEKVEIDPETFKVIDGKTYLFYNKYFTNTLVSWNKEETKLKKQADIHWKRWEQGNPPK